ncbi:MAG: beta-propeller domain-containing protein [Rubrivivax sp.]|nr:beta-propeller domain-containing protein [Rubrivivax sp.]
MKSTIKARSPWGAWLAAALLTACGGGGDSAVVGDSGREAALAVSQPGELASYVQARLRLRETMLQGAPGAVFDASPATDMVVSPSAPAPVARSGTAVQEAGVDEPDLLQSDGSSIYALQPSSAGLRLSVYGRAADGRATWLTALDLPADEASTVYADGMVLSADQRSLAVVSRRWERLLVDPACGKLCVPLVGLAFAPQWQHSSVAVQRVDVSQPAGAAVGVRIDIDGTLAGSRRIGDALYVVSTHVPRLPLDALPATATAAERQAAIAATTASHVLPRQRINGGAAQPLLADTDCWVQTGNGSVAVQITTITVFDLGSPTLAHASRCFIGGAEALYMTAQSLYLATTRTPYEPMVANWIYPPDIKTDLHKFALASGGVAYRASGEVPGHLGWDFEQKSFRLSEWNGDLRVLSFTGSEGWATPADGADPAAPPPSPATLTVLRERATDQTLQPLATLPNARRPAALGKAGEQVRGVRFDGARGYLVTFRTVDPLYVLELSDPTDPRVAGELEAPGFSDQLFPLDGGLLLGVGKEADAAGLLGGAKVALFDVRDAARPQALGSVTLGARGSLSALDYSRHGLNWLAKGTVVRAALPMALVGASGTDWARGLQRFEVDTAARTLRTLPMLGTVATPGSLSLLHERSLQIGEQVYHLREGTLTGYDW